jgi:hypothetical protein
MPPQDLFAPVEAARPLAKTFGVPAASPTPDRRIAGDTPDGLVPWRACHYRRLAYNLDRMNRIYKISP